VLSSRACLRAYVPACCSRADTCRGSDASAPCDTLFTAYQAMATAAAIEDVQRRRRSLLPSATAAGFSVGSAPVAGAGAGAGAGAATPSSPMAVSPDGSTMTTPATDAVRCEAMAVSPDAETAAASAPSRTFLLHTVWLL
jgi:hypothetical protein